jgi:hypothetical protein
MCTYCSDKNCFDHLWSNCEPCNVLWWNSSFIWLTKQICYWNNHVFSQACCCFMTSMLKSPNIIIGWNAKRININCWCVNKKSFQWLTWPCKLSWQCEMQHCIGMLGMITTLHSMPSLVMDQRGFWHTINQQGFVDN